MSERSELFGSVTFALVKIRRHYESNRIGKYSVGLYRKCNGTFIILRTNI